MNTKQLIIKYLPHVHLLFWGILALVIAIMILTYAKSFLKALREIHSEKKVDGTAGKLSHKRCGLSMIIIGMLYGFIYTLHAGTKQLDPYSFTILGVILILGWRLASPEQADMLIDKLSNLKKGLLKPDNDDTVNKGNNTTVNVNQPIVQND